MQRTISILVGTAILATAFLAFAQPMALPGITPPPETYRNTAAIMLNGEVLDETYFTEGKAKLSIGMEGKLTVASVSGCNNGKIPVNNIGFQVAIKNTRTGTYYILTREQVTSIPIEDIMKKCENKDRIVIMPTDQQYSLPSNEMWVAAGC